MPRFAAECAIVRPIKFGDIVTASSSDHCSDKIEILPHGDCLLWVCAVKRRRFPVGASPTRQPLQPEAIGAVMEVTKWLKPSISVSRIGDSASVQAATRVNAEQASKRTMCRPTRLPYRGRLIRLDELSEVIRPTATPGYWRQHVHKESARNTGSPKAWSATINRKPVRDRPGALGWRRGSQYR